MVEDNKQPVKEEQLTQNREQMFSNFKGFEKKDGKLLVYYWNYNKENNCYDEIIETYPISYLNILYKFNNTDNGFKHLKKLKNMADPKLNIILPDSGEIDFDTPIDTPIDTNNEEVNFNDSDIWPVDHKEDIETRGPRDEDCVH